MNRLTLCIEGSKGAGKSSTLQKVVAQLAEQNITTAVAEPFTAANELARNQGFPGAVQMISASPEHNRQEVDFVLSYIQAASENTTADVLFYDRGWMTIYPHLFGGAWRAAEGKDSPAIQERWQRTLEAAPPTIFLHASFEVTRPRRHHMDAVSGLDTDAKLREDIEGRIAFARAHHDKIIMDFDTGTTAQEQVVAGIVDYITAQRSYGITPAPFLDQGLHI